MFERFSEPARQVVVLAQEEARTMKHSYIGTEHILLGLLREDEGLAARVLEAGDVTIEQVRLRILQLVGPGEEPPAGQIPFTPRAKRTLELALRESLSLGHNYIGTEHILLGLARENEGVAARILLERDVDSARIRDEVIRMLGIVGPEPGVDVVGSSASARIRAVAHSGPRPEIDRSWLEGLAPGLASLGPEIRRELDRSPDSGDLLLALAYTSDTRAAAALRELGVDPEALAEAVKQVRAQAGPSEDDLRRAFERAREARQQAVDKQEYETAAELRDEERGLIQALSDAAVKPEVIEQIRARLGLEPQPPDQEHEQESSG